MTIHAPSNMVSNLLLWLLGILALGRLACEAGRSGFYVDNGFRQTVRAADLPNNHKRAIKQQLLDLLGLQRRPKPSKSGDTDSAPHYMLDLYRTLEDESGTMKEIERVRESVRSKSLTLPGMERDIGEADMITSFVNHAHRNKERIRHGGRRRFYFEMSEVPDEQRLTGAELRIFKERLTTNQTLRLDLYRLLAPDDNAGRELELEATSLVESSIEGWLEFNVTHSASLWNHNSHENLGLYLIITDSQGDDVAPRSAGLVTPKGPPKKQPFMVATFKARGPHTLHQSRVRRSASPDDVSYSDQPQYGWGAEMKESTTEACQRRTLYVDFKDLRWEEWIIAPEGYSAFYCHGKCMFPLNMHMNATNHAIVQTLVHLMSPTKAPQPSCAPTKLKAISVLYFDDKMNVILKKYRNMAVQACGCH